MSKDCSTYRSVGYIHVRDGKARTNSEGEVGEVAEVPQRVELHPGDTVASTAATTVTRADGDVETYPAGTILAVTD